MASIQLLFKKRIFDQMYFIVLFSYFKVVTLLEKHPYIEGSLASPVREVRPGEDWL